MHKMFPLFTYFHKNVLQTLVQYYTQFNLPIMFKFSLVLLVLICIQACLDAYSFKNVCVNIGFTKIGTERERERGRKKERASVCCYTSQMAETARSGAG